MIGAPIAQNGCKSAADGTYTCVDHFYGGPPEVHATMVNGVKTKWAKDQEKKDAANNNTAKMAEYKSSLMAKRPPR